MGRLAATLQRLLLAVAWVVVACAIALGSAGLAAALDHQPGTAARPELTWAGDQAVAARFDEATSELAAIARLVDDLGLQGRGSLAALTARDFELLDRTTAQGGILVSAIGERSAALRQTLEGLEFGAVAAFAYSPQTRARHAQLLEGAEATGGLALAWARLVNGGLAAARLSALLAAHDERITAAIEVGRGGQFDEAIRRIEEATAALDEAEALRDRLANNVDVATLDEWLRRNRQYDLALRELYLASAESPERVTPAIRAALAAERAARDQLPETTRPLTIVMADIAQGGLNQAVIAVEAARGELAAALGRLGEDAATPAP